MKLLIYIIIGVFTISTYAQDEDDASVKIKLSEIAMLDLEPNNSTVALNIVGSKNVGEKALVETQNNDKWINFSSAISNSSSSRNISIKIENGRVPAGIYLKLNTLNYSGAGDGELGSPKSVVTVDNSSQTIISNIRGAYTGDGVNNGYELIYFLEIYDYKLLDFDQSETLSISLTLTDF